MNCKEMNDCLDLECLKENCDNSTFEFPPPPRLCSSGSPWYCSISDTDTAGSDSAASTPHPFTRPNPISIRTRPRRRILTYPSDTSPAPKLPPIGVFWDIENCQVPKCRSALSVVQLVRNKFFSGFREAEFIVVCDVKKETNQVVQELNDAQVNLIHVASQCKNAADEKLRQCMRRFADTHGAPSAIILISGDINFAADLSDLRHRKKIHVILLHKQNASEALILCANETHCYNELTDSLPSRNIIPKVPAPKITCKLYYNMLCCHYAFYYVLFSVA